MPLGADVPISDTARCVFRPARRSPGERERGYGWMYGGPSPTRALEAAPPGPRLRPRTGTRAAVVLGHPRLGDFPLGACDSELLWIWEGGVLGPEVLIDDSGAW